MIPLAGRRIQSNLDQRFVPCITCVFFQRAFCIFQRFAIQFLQKKRDAVRFCERLDKSGVPISCSDPQPVMHMCNPQPFNAQCRFIVNKIMREANRIQTARNSKQQALETMTANIFR